MKKWLSLLFPLLCSCNHLPPKNENFNGITIATGGLLIAGVSDKNGRFNAQESTELATVVIKALNDERGYVFGAPPAELEQGLGTEKYTALLSTFAVTDPGSGDLAAIAAALPHTRYVAIARIESDRDGGVNTSLHDDGKKDGVRHYTLSVYHVRLMTVTVIIYDLTRSTAALSSRVDALAYNKVDYEFDKYEHAGLVGALFDSAYNGAPEHRAHYEPPELPSRGAALSKAIHTFAHQLPVLFCDETPRPIKGCYAPFATPRPEATP